jgi:hypothetical protein
MDANGLAEACDRQLSGPDHPANLPFADLGRFCGLRHGQQAAAENRLGLFRATIDAIAAHLRLDGTALTLSNRFGLR